MKLIIGEANYSSWSMRAWLVLAGFGLDFTTQKVSLAPPDGLRQRLLAYSPTAKVPVLIDGTITVWDSLAIGEYVSENYLEGGGLPTDKADRAAARSIIAEMHGGFPLIRQRLPMNIRAVREVYITAVMRAEVQRIEQIWAGHCPKSGWLFGDFSIADCFYAPVAMRFKTYGLADELSPPAKSYYDFICASTVVQQWCDMAMAESSVVLEDETGYPK